MQAGTIAVHGAPGSPYSLKLRAYLRYKRLPHTWHVIDFLTSEVFRHVPVRVIPVVRWPDGTWANDTTPIMERIEEGETWRPALPADPARAFAAWLLEDMADEWGSKLMFRARWAWPEDVAGNGRFIAYVPAAGQGAGAAEARAALLAGRQVGRMEVVGATPANAPLLDRTEEAIAAAFDAVALAGPFLFGPTPSVADFGWFGQLVQMANDPTPGRRLRSVAPWATAWLGIVDDASGIEEDRGEPELSPPVRRLLELAGEVYIPYLAANEAALAAGRETLAFEAFGHPFRQAPIRYQGKCLQVLRRRFARLDESERATVAAWLRDPQAVACLSSTVS